jgi:hypothetical protein
LTESTLYIGQESIGFKKPYKASIDHPNSTYSDIQEQEMGVPQGSILSVTLFSIKINSLAKVLNDNIEVSLYVDDFLILRALRLLFLSILIWGRKVSLLSKRRSKNLVSETILIEELYNFNSGSGWSAFLEFLSWRI